jgi:anti-sigma factor RsiW
LAGLRLIGWKVCERVNHMKCQTCTQSINDYIGGTLPEAKAAAVRAHLAECPACAQLATQLSGTVALIREMGIEQTSPDFMDSLRGKIRIAVALQRRPMRLSMWDRILPVQIARPVAAAAVAALVLVISFGPAPRGSSVDLAQTDYAKFCATEHAAYVTGAPVDNQATEWLDTAPVSWTDDAGSGKPERTGGGETGS